MNILALIAFIAFGLALCFAVGVTVFWRSERTRAEEIAKDLREAREKIEAEETSVRAALENKIKAETELQETRKSLIQINSKLEEAYSERNAALLQREEADKKAALREQHVEEMKKRMADWESAQAKMQTSTQAVLFDAAKQLSDKLFSDHKKEAEENRKQHEESFRKTTDSLTQNLKVINETVASLNTQVKETRERSDVVWQALTNPSGAGQFSEIGLENTLKEFGLEPGRDFVIQKTVQSHDGGARLRPDAIVFLPGDRILAIDSKASKHLLEVSAAKTNEEEQIALKQLASRMRQHLRDLTSKDYGRAIQSTYEQTGHKGRIRSTVNMMFIPSESIVERIKSVDRSVLTDSISGNVLIAGPTTLAGLLGLAKNDIETQRQEENHESIIRASQQLVESVGTLISHTSQVGKGIQSAAKSYRQMVNSINGRLLPRAKKLTSLGVKGSMKAPLPRNLPAFEVIVHDHENLIEGEAEEVAGDEKESPQNINKLIQNK